MNKMITDRVRPAAHDILAQRSADMEESLKAAYLASLSPANTKSLRLFSAGEASKFLGISPSFLRTMHGRGLLPPVHETRGGNRYYSAEAIDAIRHTLEAQAKTPGTYIKGRSEGTRMAVIAVATFKGGAGKTTSSINIGEMLALRGYRTLLVDVDPQGSLTTFFGVRPEVDLEGVPTLYDAIRYDEPVSMAQCVQQTFMHGLSMVPADLQLHTFEHETPLWMLNQRQLPEEDRSPLAFYERLSAALSDVDDDFDVVILDCPPSLGFLTLCALCAATGMIITVVPSMLDLESLASFMKMSSELLGAIAAAGLPMSWDFQKFLLSRYEPGDIPQTQLAAYLRRLFGDDVLDAAMLKSTAIGDAGLTRQALVEIDRSAMNRQTYDRAMEAISGVTDEIEALIQMSWGR